MRKEWPLRVNSRLDRWECKLRLDRWECRECLDFPESILRILICFFMRGGPASPWPLPLDRPLALERPRFIRWRRLGLVGRVLIPCGMTAIPGRAFFCLCEILCPLECVERPRPLETELAVLRKLRMDFSAMLWTDFSSPQVLRSSRSRSSLLATLRVWELLKPERVDILLWCVLPIPLRVDVPEFSPERRDVELISLRVEGAAFTPGRFFLAMVERV